MADGSAPRDNPAIGGTGDQRRVVTILFADLAGFTALAERLDPEEVTGLLNRCFDRLVPCIERYGGTVDKFIGDSVMALFGAPVAQERDPEGACRAALEMRSELAAFNEDEGQEFGLHIGINTGRVLAGSVGGGGRQEYSVIGDAVNIAARLQQVSRPGQILIGPDTQRLVNHQFITEPGEEIEIRGRSERLVPYRLIEERQLSGAFNAGRTKLALVGRENERRTLQAALDRLEAGQGGAAFVLGDTGIGKSRLLAEIREAAAWREIDWLQGAGAPFGHNLSYLPFREMLQADLGITPRDDTSVSLEKLVRRLEHFHATAPHVTRFYLASLLGLPVPADFAARLRSVDGNRVRLELHEAVCWYLRARATERPLVIAVDDLHWIDTSSSALLLELLSLAGDCPILLCMAGRPDGDGSIESLLNAAAMMLPQACLDIRLGPLQSEATQALIAALMGVKEVPRRLEQVIEQRSGGNPLFIEEVVRGLIDVTGRTREETATLSLASSALPLSIPETLQGVIMSRVDKLPVSLREFLSLASVIGQTFTHRILLALVEEPADVVALNLAELHRLDFMAAYRRGSELYHTFRPTMVQEVVYNSIPLKRRRDYHHRFARAVETTYADRLPEFYGLLGYHYTQAEDWEKAQKYLLLAGNQGADLSADVEALSQYEQAIANLMRAFAQESTASDGLDAADWLVERMNAFWVTRRLGDLLEPVKAFHARVREVYGPADHRTLAAAAILGASYNQSGLLNEADQILSEAVRACKPSGPRERSCLRRLLAELGDVRLCQARYDEAEQYLRQALDLEATVDEQDRDVTNLAYLRLTAVCNYDARLEDCARAVTEWLSLPNVRGTPRYYEMLVNICSAYTWLGRLNEAEHFADEVMRGAVAPYPKSIAAEHLGYINMFRGNYSQSAEHFAEALRIAEDLGRTSEAAAYVVGLAEAQLLEGRLDEAARSAQRGVDLRRGSPEAGDPEHAERMGLYTLAGVALARGQVAQAEELLAEVDVDAVPEQDPFRARALFRVAELRRIQGRPDEAESCIQQAVKVFERLGVPDHPLLRALEAGWTRE